jgi:hypothetical protein
MVSIISLAPKTFSYLVSQAKLAKVVNYKDVALAVGTHHRVVPKVLEIIRTICIDHNLPPLTAIVISKTTGKPGEAFLDPWLSRDTTDAHKMRLWREMLGQVFRYDWDAALKRFGDN